MKETFKKSIEWKRRREVDERVKNFYARFGMYAFIIGALLSVLDSAFPVALEMRSFVYAVLIFTGVFAGLLNISEDEEHHFLLATTAFILVLLAFNQFFAAEPTMRFLNHFFENAMAFAGSMALVVGLRIILEFGSQNYRVTPQEDMEARTAAIEDWELSKRMQAWHFTIFVAVALTFILLLLDMFFTVPAPYDKISFALNWLIVLIFIIDLVVLYKEEASMKSFLHNCWVDIIAALPVVGVFRVIKIVRLARIARLTRVSHSLKFFSSRSGHNTYLRKSPRRTEDLKVVEHPRVRENKGVVEKRRRR